MNIFTKYLCLQKSILQEKIVVKKALGIIKTNLSAYKKQYLIAFTEPNMQK